MSIHKTPPLVQRYLAKLGGNSFGVVFNLINASIVPRALGTVAYGNFEFLLSFFNQIIGFFDMGTSTAFYNKLSRRNNDIGIIHTYGQFVIGVFLIILLFIEIVWFFNLESKVWPQQEWSFIFLSALLSYLIWVHNIFRKVIDAFGCTIRSELMVVIIKSIGLVMTIILFQGSWLTLSNLFIKELVFYFLLILTFSWIILQFRKTQVSTYSSSEKEVLKELWKYSSPLIFAAMIGLIVGLTDRWLLQKYSGSEEQGFYSLAFRIAGVSFIFTAAMIQLIMREYSIHYEKGEIEKIRGLFKRYLPMLYALSAYLASFISLQADTIVWLFAGDRFMGAGAAMMYMAFYPVHQTYGQMNGALLLAAEKTKLYGNISVSLMLLGLLSTWFLLMPVKYGGVNSGSVGLATKMLIVQFIGVNIQLWFNTKMLSLKFNYFFLHQIAVIILFLSLSWLATSFSFWISLPRIYTFFMTGLLYTFFVIISIYYFPKIVGLNKKESGIVCLKTKSIAKNFFS